MKHQVERINAAELTPKKFFNQYVRKRQPVVIQEAFNSWPAFEWTTEKLKKKAGDLTLLVESRESSSDVFGKDNKVPMRFSHFLDRMDESDGSLYHTTEPIPESPEGPLAVVAGPLAKLTTDFPLCPELIGKLVPYQVNLWMGGSTKAGSTTGLHHDFHDNLYVVFRGTKEFRIYPASDLGKLKTVGGNAARLLPNGLISYDGQIREDGARMSDVVDWEQRKIEEALTDLQAKGGDTAELESRLEETMDRQLEFMENDEETEAVQPDTPNHFCTANTVPGDAGVLGQFINVRLQRGDMLYLPASWFHEVHSFAEPDSYHQALNFWYYPPVSKGTFEKPYEDDYWKERAAPLVADFSNGTVKTASANLAALPFVQKGMKKLRRDQKVFVQLKRERKVFFHVQMMRHRYRRIAFTRFLASNPFGMF